MDGVCFFLLFAGSWSWRVLLGSSPRRRPEFPSPPNRNLKTPQPHSRSKPLQSPKCQRPQRFQGNKDQPSHAKSHLGRSQTSSTHDGAVCFFQGETHRKPLPKLRTVRFMNPKVSTCRRLQGTLWLGIWEPVKKEWIQAK